MKKQTPKIEWVNVPMVPGKNSYPNLNVLKVNGIEVGFIWKPKDTKSDKNAWKVMVGIGEKSQLVCNDSFCKNHAKNQLILQILPTHLV